MARCRRRMARRSPICPAGGIGAWSTPRISGLRASMSASITSVLLAPAIALRSRAESRLATNPTRHPDSEMACSNGSHVPAVGSATTIAGAQSAKRTVSSSSPASVGCTRKSSAIPGPRTATWCAATTAASIPIDTTGG